MLSLQYLYTSWREFGFSVYGCSPGMADSLLAQLQRAAKYTAPAGLPDTSDPETIAALYPENLSNVYVAGRQCILHANYLGQDASNRFGNYIAHGLLPEAEPGFRPIELLDAPVWKRSLAEPEKAAGSGPHPMPMTDVLPHDKMSLTAVGEFLCQPLAEEKAALVLNAFLFAHQTRRKFYLHDTAERLPFWFAVVQYALSVPLANRMTFATYLYDYLERALDMAAVPSEGCFMNYRAEAGNGRMVVLDLAEGFSTANIPQTRVAAFLVFALAFVPQSREAFHAFLDALGLPEPFGDLENAYLAYLLYQGRPEELRPDEVVSALTLMGRSKNLALTQAVDAAVTDRLSGFPAEPGTLYAIATILFARAAAPGQLYPALNDIVLSSLLAGNALSETVPFYRQTLCKRETLHAVDFADFALSNACAPGIILLLADGGYGAEGLVRVMGYVGALSARTPEALSNKASILEQYLRQCLSGGADKPQMILALQACVADSALLARCLGLVASAPGYGQEFALEAARQISNLLGEDGSARLENSLMRNEATAELALGCLLSRAHGSAATKAFWYAYQSYFTGYADPALRSRLVQRYLEQLDHGEQFAQAVRLLAGGFAPDADACGFLMRLFLRERMETLLGKHLQATQRILRMARAYRLLEGKAACLSFVAAALATDNPPGFPLGALLQANPFCVTALDKRDYADWIVLALGAAAGYLRTGDELLLLLERVSLPGEEKALSHALQDVLRTDRTGGLSILLLQRLTQPGVAHPILARLAEDLAAAFAKVDEKTFEKLLLTAQIPLASMATNPFLERVQALRSKLLGNRIRNLFTGPREG